MSRPNTIVKGDVDSKFNDNNEVLYYIDDDSDNDGDDDDDDDDDDDIHHRESVLGSLSLNLSRLSTVL